MQEYLPGQSQVEIALQYGPAVQFRMTPWMADEEVVDLPLVPPQWKQHIPVTDGGRQCLSYTTTEQIYVTCCLLKTRNWQRNCTSTSHFSESWLCRTPRTPTPPKLSVYVVLLKCFLSLEHGGEGVENKHWWTLLHLKLKDYQSWPEHKPLLCKLPSSQPLLKCSLLLKS